MEALNKVDPIKRSPDAFVLIQVIFTTHDLYNTPVSLLHNHFHFTTGYFHSTTGQFSVYDRPVFGLPQATLSGQLTTGHFVIATWRS